VVPLAPTIVTPLLELVEEGEELEPVEVEPESDVDEDTNGFESEEMAADVKSMVNWRVLDELCWFML
jgi:hypothetical protein